MTQTLGKRQRARIATILLVASFISLMSQTMMVTALPVIQEELHQSLAVVQWLTTGYTLLIGVITPLSANLYEKYPNRQFYLAIITLFLVGTLVGTFANSFWPLLLARLIQAAAGGLLVAFQMTTVVSIYPPEQRGMIMGLSSLVVSFGPAIGPTLAGVIIKSWGWRSIFWSVLPFMLVCWLFGYFALPNYTTPKPESRLDPLSVITLLVGPGMALASLSVMTTHLAVGLALLVVGSLVSLVFYRRQRQLKAPLLDFGVFSYRAFRLMLAVATLIFMALLATEQMFSIFAQNSLHLSSSLTGLVLLPGALFNALAGAFIGRIYDQHGVKGVTTVGLVIAIACSVPPLFWTAHTSALTLTLLYAGRVLGIGIAFSPVMSESYRGLPHAAISQATAMNNALRQSLGALAVTVTVVISSLPSSAISGMRWAMAFTLGLVVAAGLLFWAYLAKEG